MSKQACRSALIKKSPLGLFRSLLHQILDQAPDLLSEFCSVFKKKRDTEGDPGKKWEWHEAELRKFLEDSITRAPEEYTIRIYIDALDECDGEVARNLVVYFQRLTSKLAPNKATLSICFSCRYYPIVALEHGLEVSVEKENYEDIVTYVRGELESEISDKDKAKELETTIAKSASGVFQWVVLVVPEALKLHRDGRNIIAIQTMLNQIPKELNTLYESILQKLADREKSISLQLMQWICFAQRPLSLEELRFAMVVSANTRYYSLRECQESEDYVETSEAMERRVKSLSGGLAEVKEHHSKRIVQFIHQSVNDYLTKSGLRKLGSSSTSNVDSSAHFQLSRSCIKYIAMEEVLHCSSADGQDLQREFPFLHYAITNWVTHAQIVEKAKEISQEDLLSLFQWPSSQILQCWIHLYRIVDYYSNRCPETNMSLLHIVLWYGLLSVLTAIFNSKNDDNIEVESKDKRGRTPLSRAAEGGTRR